MSHAQMAASNRRANVPMRVRLNTNNVRIKVIAVGVMASGKIALALAIKSDASHAGMDTRIRPLPIAPKTINRNRVSAAMRHQTVRIEINLLILY
jgi:hypothetical protein